MAVKFIKIYSYHKKININDQDCSVIENIFLDWIALLFLADIYSEEFNNTWKNFVHNH